MKEVIRKTLDEAVREVNEVVEIFQRSGIQIEILNVRIVPEVIREDEELEYDCWNRYEYEDDFFVAKLREGKYFKEYQYIDDFETAEIWDCSFRIEMDDYVTDLSVVNLEQRLLAIDTLMGSLSGVEVDWKLIVDEASLRRIDSDIPFDKERLCAIIDDYASNLDEAYLAVIRRKLERIIRIYG